MSRRGRFGRLAAGLAATVMLCAGLVGLTPAGPAYAADVCTGSTGVTVVVDFHQLGGGVRSACVAGGGGDRAADLFPAAGFPLRDLPRQPGFVCQVSGVPSDGKCAETDAYWSLWSSSGSRGSSWAYASVGVASLRIPDGGLVAFSWNASTSRVPPGASAQRPTPAPSSGGGGQSGGSGGSGSSAGGKGGGQSGGGASSTPSAPSSGSTGSTGGDGATADGGGGRGPGGIGGSGGSGAAGTTDGPGAADGADRDRRDGTRNRGNGTARGRDGRAGESPSEAPADADDPSDPAESAVPGDLPTEAIGSGEDVSAQSGDDGLPVWVAPGLVVVLLAGAGTALVLRRRSAGDPR